MSVGLGVGYGDTDILDIAGWEFDNLILLRASERSKNFALVQLPISKIGL